ncbi:MAG: hypothetical protein IT236_07935, partial [Bacteroidia bacterium]|nr:hypothetical protein [Bacteroidia bacterium]
MANLIRLLIFLLLTQFIQAQQSLVKQFAVTRDIFGTRVFVENKGQFDVMVGFKEKVLYALDNDAEKIFFTKSGLYYEFKEEKLLSEREREKLEEGKLKKRKDDRPVYVKSTWMNSDTARVSIIPGNKQQHYVTSGGPEWNACTFKKLLYKNVYPQVDIEYIIPEDPGTGIKYTVIVHPGGNAEQVKILYSGDVKKLRKTKQGQILITSIINESITEHCPKSYYNDNTPVSSEFKITGDTVSFNFPENHNRTKTLLIDPWVVTTTNLSTTTAAYDVDYDVQGNTYIYGGKNPFKLAKYSNGGVLLWTFSGALPAFGWVSDPEPYAGNFCINKFNGKAYIGQGVNLSGTQVIRLNSTGNYDFYMSTADSIYQEVWDMAISCITGEVVAFGGGHTSNLSAATISNITLNLAFATFQPSNLNPRQDVASHCVDDAGNFYVLYSTIANAAVNDKICKVNATFNGNVWTQPSGFLAMAEAGNKTLYGGGGATDSNGLNCLAVNSTYLYYYDGLNLAAYTASTGVMIASTTVNAPNYRERGGIAVDNCNNLYLGGLNQVLRYQFTGTAFVQQTAITLAVSSATNSYVFDIKLDKSAAILYVCGQGFVGTYNASATANCGISSNSCYNSNNPVFGM